jgi:cytochrome oxidase Cu insertion factor (SCO1/SenC/PrrC family)
VFKPSINLLARSAAIAAILFIASAPAAAGNAPADAADAAAAEAKARDYFSNVELVDQDGRSLKFYDEVLKDNIVVISFIFTNCQSACPLMTRNLTMIRDMLREDERRSIQFISISIDPLRDTPSAMKEFAQKGWLWLTGQPDDVNYITKRLGSYTDDPEMHTTTLLAANVPNAHWTKIEPNVPPKMRHRDLRNGAVAARRTTRQAAAAPFASVLAFAGIVMLLPDSGALGADLTEAEERGKYIYEPACSRSRAS